jgi:HEAT repeat protein
MGPPAKAAAPDLIRALNDPKWMTRTMACEALAKIGADVETAVPALRKSLNDEDITVRQAARRALRKIDPKTTVEPDRR